MNNALEHRSLGAIEYTKTQSLVRRAETLSDHRIVTGLYNDPRADIFRILRTTILRQLRENNWNSFVVTSATPGAGKTSISINLAIAMSMDSNHSVILLDADLRRPSVASYFGFEPEFGLLDYLQNICPAGYLHETLLLEDVLINPGFERLVVLPGKGTTAASSELVSSPRMADLARELKSRYESRVVIVDAPPVLLADDALLLLPNVDGAVLVVEDGKNTAEELQRAMHLLEQTNLLGIVLNKAQSQLLSEGYRYGYGQEQGV